jgi:hypothetical protein
MNELHADPLTADVTGSQNSTSTSYGDLTTVGPAVTKTLVNGQKVLVEVSCDANTVTGGEDGWMSFAVSGATTLAALDVNAAHLFMTGSAIGAMQISRSTVFTATAGGSHTFTAKYRSETGATVGFSNRRIIIKPF